MRDEIDYSEKVIEVKEVKKSFGDMDVLKGVDLHLYKGENLVVLGKSGSGKSVLIKLVVRLLKADEGTIDVLGKRIDKLSVREMDELRLKIGFSFQNSALYDSMTVRENLAFPLVRNKRLTRKETEMKIEEALEDVGLLRAINQMPSELSGGMRKRIGIARTLILNPEIMLYDEPTAGLDPITCIEINELINEVQEKYHTSSIIITHDLTCAKQTGDRVVVLIDGQFKTEGTFEEVSRTQDPNLKPFFDYNFIE
ncbi:ABC transporter ATP-binding protein [Penaeicola halotolerans]|uniref:ABC transporter ATP-binding protein n=1 Tax=Penaeicola halotolerans TaxID=2793196 RepID=UPI001CF8A5FD|nr:ATP-binding cassette domain-containing protein [Penaeicola halotolerans]